MRLLRRATLGRFSLGRFSLRARLLLLTAGLLLAGLSLVGALVSDELQRYQLDRLDGQLRSFSDLVAQAVPSDPRAVEGTTPRPDLLDAALELVGTPYLVHLAADGTVLGDLHSTRLDDASLPTTDRLGTVPTDGSAVDLPAADGSGRWRAVARPASGWPGTVVAAAPLAELDATIARLRTASVVSGAVLLVLLTAVGWFALGRGLRPLRRIESTAAAIAAGDLTQRVPGLAPSSTEIGHLGESLNTMLGQLEQAFADRSASETRMRSFVWDVSHELRTPLFGITGTTELYRMRALPERADVDQAMHRIAREATRLTALTQDLLLLAQLDEMPEGQLDRAPMDLRTLANDARLDLRALDPTRPVELAGPDGSGPPAAASVHADEAQLRQVVTNLVGNAAAHTPPGTPVRIGVGTVAGRAVLDVLDQGPGMTAEQAERVFDRFYRADRSRSRSGGASAGLGLAIARSLARAHDGDVELRTAPGAGARFRLTLPVLDQR
ncbi:sensor histidine kinase [Modestobacter sp. VKM Ac-2978]|uniref:sensor histidine kinase n=1 Tax=Modestobacter sp. VKM Ac-2978 TaxID=3004132 RepID=UPI0022AAC507|nr:HAMP domain-containing sensor histidine kinase [Modestobacter sp. VKM Ac-2978]MCZ2849676.1 HAMP domain-containing sensor histidine kinase [Modestobacter sp. VKM Ac-2978]